MIAERINFTVMINDWLWRWKLGKVKKCHESLLALCQELGIWVRNTIEVSETYHIDTTIIRLSGRIV